MTPPKDKTGEFLLGEINESCKWMKGRLANRNRIMQALEGRVLNRKLQNG